MNESSAAAGGADTGTAVLTSGELESAGESAHAAENSKIIYTANLTLESKDYDAARAALDAALAEAGGYLESSDEYANSGSRRSLSLTLRVPQENYESFLAAVAATGNVTYKSQQAEEDVYKRQCLIWPRTSRPRKRPASRMINSTARTLP